MYIYGLNNATKNFLLKRIGLKRNSNIEDSKGENRNSNSVLNFKEQQKREKRNNCFIKHEQNKPRSNEIRQIVNTIIILRLILFE